MSRPSFAVSITVASSETAGLSSLVLAGQQLAVGVSADTGLKSFSRRNPRWRPELQVRFDTRHCIPFCIPEAIFRALHRALWLKVKCVNTVFYEGKHPVASDRKKWLKVRFWIFSPLLYQLSYPATRELPSTYE